MVFHSHSCYTDKPESISFMLRKTVAVPISKKKKKKKKETTKNKSKNKNKIKVPPYHTITEDVIGCNISPMTSTSKVYIPSSCHLNQMMSYHDGCHQE